MKFFVIALLLCVTPIASSSTDGVGENEYRVIPFTTNLKEAMKNDSDWKMCGNYFAEVGIAEKKIVHFSFDKGSPGKPSAAFTFTMIDQVAVSINEKVPVPLVMILGNEQEMKFVFVMSMKDYEAGLPCLARGTEV